MYLHIYILTCVYINHRVLISTQLLMSVCVFFSFLIHVICVLWPWSMYAQCRNKRMFCPVCLLVYLKPLEQTMDLLLNTEYMGKVVVFTTQRDIINTKQRFIIISKIVNILHKFNCILQVIWYKSATPLRWKCFIYNLMFLLIYLFWFRKAYIAKYTIYRPIYIYTMTMHPAPRVTY